MKKLLVILLVFVFLVPSVVSAAPPPEGPPPPGFVPPVGPKAVKVAPGLDLTDMPRPEALPDTELLLEKRAKAEALARSLSQEQAALIAGLLAPDPLAAQGRGGAAVPLSAESLSLQMEATASKLAEILTPEQYALYQESMLAPLGDVETQTYQDCYDAYVYSYYGNQYAYWAYYYAYYANAAGEHPITAGVEDLEWNIYDVPSWYGYLYAYYAYYYYPYADYALYANIYNFWAYLGSFHAYPLKYDAWYFSTGGGTYENYTYYAYVFDYYAYIYHAAATDSSYYCYCDQVGC
jgi:hypothetical protein